MKTLNLSQHKVAVLDDVDYNTFSSYKWSFDRYAIRKDYSNKNKRRTVYLHREIMRPVI